MSGLHTVPDAAEDQQLLLDVRALLERSQRQAAKNRALEAHREKVEATLGRVQEALGAAPRRRDGFEELDGDHELSAALRAAARDSAALDARVEDAAALPEESRAALGEMHGALRSLRALALLLPLFYAGYAGIAAGACAALGVPFESAAAIFGHFDFGPAGLVDLLDGAAAAAGGDAAELARVAAARWLAAVAAFVVLGPPLLCVVVRLDVARPPPLGRGARRRCCGWLDRGELGGGVDARRRRGGFVHAAASGAQEWPRRPRPPALAGLGRADGLPHRLQPHRAQAAGRRPLPCEDALRLDGRRRRRVD